MVGRRVWVNNVTQTGVIDALVLLRERNRAIMHITLDRPSITIHGGTPAGWARGRTDMSQTIAYMQNLHSIGWYEINLDEPHSDRPWWGFTQSSAHSLIIFPGCTYRVGLSEKRLQPDRFDHDTVYAIALADPDNVWIGGNRYRMLGLRLACNEDDAGAFFSNLIRIGDLGHEHYKQLGRETPKDDEEYVPNTNRKKFFATY